jgi:carboxyl-terminal processing protease
VKILIKHIGSPNTTEFSIIRGTIPLQSVYVRSKEDDPLLHIRISDFYPNTVDQLQKVLIESQKKGITKGIILDIRNNPGGTISAVVDVADQFLSENILLYDISGNGRRSQWKTTNDGLAINVPMVVLINKGSASASEVLAGALQDYNRAPLIGETTYGKGSVNILRRLSNDGGLYLTWALWYTPSGRMINNSGLKPNIVVTDQDAREAERKQLERAQTELLKIIELSNHNN